MREVDVLNRPTAANPIRLSVVGLLVAVLVGTTPLWPGSAQANNGEDIDDYCTSFECILEIWRYFDCHDPDLFLSCNTDPVFNQFHRNVSDPIEPALTEEDLSNSEESGGAGSGIKKVGNQMVVDKKCPPDPNNMGMSLAGNPFNLYTGNKVEHVVDYAGPSRLPLTFSRVFNSANLSSTQGPIGRKWTVGVPRLETWTTSISPPVGQSDWLGMVLIREDGQRVKMHVSDGGTLPGMSHPTLKFTRTNGRVERLHKNDSGTWNYLDGTTEYRFASDGKLTLQVDHPTGEYLKYNYNAQSGESPSQIVHSSGRTLTFTYASGRLTRMTDPAGNHTDYTYNARNNLTRVDYPNGDFANYYYENSTYPDNLTRVVDSSGLESRWVYDSAGRVQSSENNGGINKVTVLSRTTSGSEKHVRTRNALGKEATHRFKNVAGRWRLVGTNGHVLGNCAAANDIIEYDANGYHKTLTDREGNETDHFYDSNGLLEKIVEAPGTSLERETHFEFDSVSRQLLRTWNNLQEASYDYDDHGRVQEIRVSDQPSALADRVWTITYPVTSITAEGTTLVRQMFVDGPRTGTADTTKFFYDSAGRLVSILNAANHLTQFTNYDANGRPRTITYPGGMVTNVVYNSRGWVTSKTDVVQTRRISDGGTFQQNRTTAYNYNPNGTLDKVTFPDSSFLEFSYDALSRLKIIENALGEWIALDYDNASNVERERIRHNETTTTNQISCCGPMGEPILIPVTQTVAVTDRDTNYDYDALSRLEQITNGNGNSSLIRYNKNDLLRLVQDAKGRQTTRNYNARNELNQITQRDGGIVGMTYDDNALPETVTDAINVTTTYERNAFGQTKFERNDDNGDWEYGYDEAGNLVSVKDARTLETSANYETTYIYDSLNRVERIDHPSGVDTVFNYNATTGWLDSVTDDSGSTTFLRDNSGAVTRKTSVVDGVSMVTEYQYDVMGRVDQLLLPGGTLLDYDYDVAGQVERIRASHPSFSSQKTLASNITYKPFGPMTGVTLGSYQVRALDYDDDYRLTQLISANHIHKTYGYDDNDNITSASNASGVGNRTYDYDEMDRLDFHSGQEGSFTLVYDDNGNLRRRNSPSSDNFLYQSGTNRLTSAAGSARAYDHNGNTTTRGADYLTFDSRNRLSSFFRWAGYVTTNYRYNAFGERVQKYRSGFDQKFVYGGGARLMHERGAQGTVDYVYLDGAPIAIVRNGTLYYVHTDHLGRPLSVATETNSFTVWTAQDRPWESQPQTQYVDMNIRFPGQYYDEESGLYYNYFRYYDPTTGRYVSSDPIGLAGGLNRFSYASANPVSAIDPLGLSTVPAALPLPSATVPAIGGSGAAAGGVGAAATGTACVAGAGAFGVLVGIGVNLGVEHTTGRSIGSWLYNMANSDEFEDEFLDPLVFPDTAGTPGGDPDEDPGDNHNKTSTPTDRYKKILNQRHLDAARRELRGEVVKRNWLGRPYNHVKEVRDAQQGVANRIAAINRKLGSPSSGLSAAERGALVRELSQASRLLDYSRLYVP